MFERILKTLQARKNVFLTGGAGTGKSYTTKCIIENFYKSGKNVVALGSTGISAVNIGGITLHSFFRFGRINDINELAKHDKTQRNELKELYKVLSKLDLIIIDEISMVSAELMEMINYRLIQGNFKGRVMVVGDFYQLPPVKKQDDGSLMSFCYAFDSTAWYNLKFKNVELVISKRTSDIKFYSMLSRIRLGIIDDEIYQNLRSKITNVIPEDSIVLFGKNAQADMLNAKRLAQIPNPLISLKASGEIYDENLDKNAYERWVNSLNVLSDLQIKIDARIMFLSNKRGEYYNGEQGIIKELNSDDGGNIVSISVLKDSGEMAQVEPFTYSLIEYERDGESINERLRAEFTQFPLKLAYAITIHKSQGMSIDRLVCNLDNIFANGQLYVALSRAISWDNLKIVYTKSRDFGSYLKSVVNIDDNVKEFYLKEKFIREDI